MEKTVIIAERSSTKFKLSITFHSSVTNLYRKDGQTDRQTSRHNIMCAMKQCHNNVEIYRTHCTWQPSDSRRWTPRRETTITAHGL